jgi:hypothetical protein
MRRFTQTISVKPIVLSHSLRENLLSPAFTAATLMTSEAADSVPPASLQI